LKDLKQLILKLQHGYQFLVNYEINFIIEDKKKSKKKKKKKKKKKYSDGSFPFVASEIFSCSCLYLESS